MSDAEPALYLAPVEMFSAATDTLPAGNPAESELTWATAWARSWAGLKGVVGLRLGSGVREPAATRLWSGADVADADADADDAAAA
jgi:hypothetical protein